MATNPMLGSAEDEGMDYVSSNNMSADIGVPYQRSDRTLSIESCLGGSRNQRSRSREVQPTRPTSAYAETRRREKEAGEKEEEIKEEAHKLTEREESMDRR